MRYETKQILLAAATLCVAGCAKSDFQVGRENRADKRPMSNSAMANIPEEKPPKILPETHFAAGLLFERQGQFDRAIPQYRKAVALNHNYVVAFHRLGLLESATGQHLQAAQTLQKAVALRPDNAVLHNDLGFEWMSVQQWENAEGELRRAIELQPDLATAHINLAMVQAKSERFAESLASFQQVLPEPDAYYNLGLMLRGQQRYPEALEAFRHVLTIAPEFSAAKIQIEQLSAQAGSPAPAESVGEAPKSEPAVVEAPFMEEEEEYAVKNEHEWGTTLADLAAILAVLDADAVKDSDPPIDRASVGDDVTEWKADDDLAGRPVIGEFIEESSLDLPTTAAADGLADAPCQEESMMPSMVVPLEEAVAVFGEIEGDEPPAVDFVEEPQMIAATEEFVGPPDPCDPEFEEVDADDVIVATPVEPITRPVGIRDSWAMLEELEGKIAMLQFETQAARAEKAYFGDLAFRYDVLMTPTWIEQGARAIDAYADHAATEDSESDDLNVPFVEIYEDDPGETQDPTPSDVIEEEIRDETSPSDRTSLWTTEFGELDVLFSIVRNETVCWDDLDAQTRDVLALADADWSNVEEIEQAVSSESDEFSPAMPSEADDSMDDLGNERTAHWAIDRSGDIYSYPRGLEPLPD